MLTSMVWVVWVFFYFPTIPMVSALNSKAALSGAEIAGGVMEAYVERQ